MFGCKTTLLSWVVLLGLLCMLRFPCAPVAAAAPYSGQTSTLLGDSQQSALVREVSKAHAEQLAKAEEDIAQLVRELKALHQGDPERDHLASQLRQRQQALRDLRDKFRDQLLCILRHEADLTTPATVDSKLTDEVILRNCTGTAALSVNTTEAPVNVAERR